MKGTSRNGREKPFMVKLGPRALMIAGLIQLIVWPIMLYGPDLGSGSFLAPTPRTVVNGALAVSIAFFIGGNLLLLLYWVPHHEAMRRGGVHRPLNPVLFLFLVMTLVAVMIIAAVLY